MPGKYFLTTPLYYVNSKPHIGHSYTEIAADVLARYMRTQLGKDNVKFLTGTDEHGQKIARAADAANMKPKEFTDKISKTFKDLWKRLNISDHDFIRTTDDRHKSSVNYVWEKIRNVKVSVNGKDENALYQHHYDGYYCVSCETFITEGLLDPNNPTLCPDCKRPLERMQEDTYFLRVSAYQNRLIEDIENDKIKILPDTRRNEVLGFLNNNVLRDLSISRPKERLSWGIPVPFDDKHVTYVWFDALINYISACGYGDKSKNDEFEKWWPADLHLIGKDIIRHHAVLWPILLYVLDLKLPKVVFAHGWWLQDGDKMSKSKGNVTDPIELCDKYRVDAYRYFLLAETPFGQDGTFSEEALIKRYNMDLANGLGNLLNRTLTMCEKYFDGRVPMMSSSTENSEIFRSSEELKVSVIELHGRRQNKIPKLLFSEALADIWAIIKKADTLIETSAPWSLHKQQRQEELKVVIFTLIGTLKAISQAIEPFMPETAKAMQEQIGLSPLKLDRYDITINTATGEFDYNFSDIQGLLISKGAPLFPRIEVKQVDNK